MKRTLTILVLAAIAMGLVHAPAAARNFFVLMSAGQATSDNTPTNSEYWYDLFLQYTCLLERGYSRDDIHVLYGDGSDFTSGIPNYRNPGPEPITDYDNHKQTLHDVLAALGSQMTSDDQLYVWWLGHGSNASGYLTMYIQHLVGGTETITDAEFASYMAQIPNYRLRVFSIMTCYSGGIIDDLQGPTSIVMTSSRSDQTSYSDDLCDNIHTEFHYFETCAYDWDTPFGLCGPVDADSDDNEMVSFAEAFVYADEGTQMSTPQLSDPGGLAPDSYLAVNGAAGGLVYVSKELSDDALGSSSGNGDGQVNPGETIELWITVRNSGTTAATQVSGVLSSASPYVAIPSAASVWPDISGGGEAANVEPFCVTVAGQAPDGTNLPFLLRITHGREQVDMGVNLLVHAPVLGYGSHWMNDAPPLGNGNGQPEPGETLDLGVTVRNAGSQDAENVVGTLTSTNPNLVVLAGAGAAAIIGAGQTGALEPPFRIALSPAAQVGEMLPLTLSFEAGFGYQATGELRLQVGAVYCDDVETDMGWSLSEPDDDATTGRWVRVDPNGTFTNGLPVQPEDDHTPDPGVFCFVTGQGEPGGAASAGDVDGGKTTLTTPTFDLSNVPVPSLEYWRWYTDDLGNNPNDDVWVVQISNDGGSSWIDLERTQVSSNSWQFKQFAVDEYITPTSTVSVRFVAADRAGGSLLEAAVDDLRIVSTLDITGVTGTIPERVLALSLPRPNPAAGVALVRFELPGPRQVALEVYGVDGRRVATLARGLLPGGSYAREWNGRTDQGLTLASGIYFVRLRADGEELTRSLTFVR